MADKQLQPHQQRVVDERQELQVKHMKLGAFIQSETFEKLDLENRLLLKAQELVMSAYIGVLDERIKKF